MAPLVVVEISEANKLVLQVASIPKRYEVEILSPDCPDEGTRTTLATWYCEDTRELSSKLEFAPDTLLRYSRSLFIRGSMVPSRSVCEIGPTCL